MHDNTGNQKKHAIAHTLCVYGEARVISFKLTATVKLQFGYLHNTVPNVTFALGLLPSEIIVVN